METVVLNGFSCGIVRTEEIPLTELDKARSEWTKCGMTCWITDPDCSHNRRDPDA